MSGQPQRGRGAGQGRAVPAQFSGQGRAVPAQFSPHGPIRGGASGVPFNMSPHARQPSNQSNPSSAGSGHRSPAQPHGAYQALTVPQHSRSPSNTSGTRSPAQGQAQPPKKVSDALKNLDLPASFFNIDRTYQLPTEFKRRPGFNDTGKQVQLTLNSWPVTRWPTAIVYQYDVTIGNGDEKRPVQRKVWDSNARKSATGTQILWDGNKLAWSTMDIPPLNIMVDLDFEQGRQPRAGPNAGNNSFPLRIRPAKLLDLSILQHYLDGRVQMSEPILEAISFLDHVLREFPSITDRFIPIKRSFFVRDAEKADLGGAVEVYRGVYQSIRLAEGHKLVINLDVANTTFFRPQSILSTLVTKWSLRDPQHIAAQLRYLGSGNNRYPNPFHKQVQSVLKRAACKVIYDGNPAKEREWHIHEIMVHSAEEWPVTWTNPQTNQVEGQVTVQQYFQRKYNVRLMYPMLPLIKMTKHDACFPIELVHICAHQRYPFKLDEKQTAAMINFAISPPEIRMRSILTGKGWLNWDNDPVLQTFGLKIGNEQIRTNARVLPPPGVEFAQGKIEQPGMRGRWDLRGKKFLLPNPGEPLSKWGVGVFPGRQVPKPAIDKFVADFVRAYRDHGGRVDSNSPPHVMMLPADAGTAVETLFTQTGNAKNARPQILIFLVQDRTSQHYMRIKKSCDCRYGVVSQVMQVQQVLKGNAQYYSNVCMKFNAKLGGTTAKAVPANVSGFKQFTKPTLIIGADVSHASPGSSMESMAALTVSWDRFAGRYAAGCQTNGHRVEVISPQNFRSILGPLITQWQAEVSGGVLPQHVIYMRDGVSEGQFQFVIQEELPAIRAILAQCAANARVQLACQFTVIIAAKRHHIRAFPPRGSPAGDKNGNPAPGVLIEHDVTTPNEFDFYLYSHIALQGTARPVHYTILYDDANMKPSFIQNMIYEHCYQYMRSTTSVSLHPAVYYAHLASNRARAHENPPPEPQGGAGNKKDVPEPPVSRPLLPLNLADRIQFKMWYI